MIALSDPCGPLGRLVLERLLQRLGAHELVALEAVPGEAAWLRARGVQVRHADERNPVGLVQALVGVERLLLLGAPAIGASSGQPRAFIEAARTAGVHLVVYTSLLHADSSPLPGAAQHREVETALRIVGLPHVLLRLGCCVEDYTAHVPAALEYQAVLGCAGMGCISCASRADYADAATAVLLSPLDEPRTVYELTGSTAFTLPELAAEISRQIGRAVRYVHLPAPLYRAALMHAGVADAHAQQLVDADAAAARDALLGSEPDLERLIGHRAMRLPEAVRRALAGCCPQVAEAEASRPEEALDLEVFA